MPHGLPVKTAAGEDGPMGAPEPEDRPLGLLLREGFSFQEGCSVDARSKNATSPTLIPSKLLKGNRRWPDALIVSWKARKPKGVTKRGAPGPH
eukprot:82687-Heterocapsa_arctica.AAC.1